MQKILYSDDHNDLLSELSLQDKPKLLAMKKILKYFSNPPAEESIHVIVELSETTATSNKVSELRKELASLWKKFNIQVHL